MSSGLPRRTALASLGLAAAVAIGGVASLARADWPQWRGPSHNGVAGENALGNLTGPPKQRWERNVGVGYSSVAVRGDRLYTMGWADGHDTVWCLSADKGEEVWRYEYPAERYQIQHEGGPSATPAVSDKHVFTLDRRADVHCVDAATGKLVWTKDLQKEYGVRMPKWPYAGSPLLLDDAVIVDAGKIFAFEPATGKLLWQTDDYGTAYSTPVPFTQGDRKLLAALPRPGLVVLNAKDGKQVATYPWTTQYGVNAATPLVVDDLIVIATGYGTGGAAVRLEGDKLTKVWQTKALASQLASPIAVNGQVYGFNENVLTCLDLDSGKPRWSERGLGKGSLVAAGGKLVILSEKGELIIADASAEGFKPIQRVPAITDGRGCWIAPVATDGRIYCRGPSGQLVCFDAGGS